MTTIKKYKDFLYKPPRRTNECWLGNIDLDNNIYVCGHKFLACLNNNTLEIWRLMDGRRTILDIVHHLKEKYTFTSKKEILSDTINFILHLENVGLAAWRSRPLFEDVKLND